MKIGFWTVLAALIGIGVLVNAVKGHHHSSSSSNTPAVSAAAPQLSLVKNSSDSYCLPDPGQARIFVSIGIRNSGDGAASVNPWATFDYSDGGNSTDDYTDTGDGNGANLTVPAHSLRVARFYHTYNPQQHDLIRCSGFLDFGDTNASGYYLPIEQ